MSLEERHSGSRTKSNDKVVHTVGAWKIVMYAVVTALVGLLSYFGMELPQPLLTP